MPKRLVHQPKAGITKANGAYWNGERAETIVSRRVRQYAREKEISKQVAAAKRAAKKLGHDFIDLRDVR